MHYTTGNSYTISVGCDAAVAAPSDGEQVRDALREVEAEERRKRIKRLTKAHRSQWYSNATGVEIAGYFTGKDTYEAAVANEMADGEIRWRITGRSGSLTFPEFVKHLVDHGVDPESVARL